MYKAHQQIEVYENYLIIGRQGMKSVECLRCNIQMSRICREKIQLGQTGWILGDLPNLFAGALEVDIYSCPRCGKIEFFQTDNTEYEKAIPQKKCPKCGESHDFDYPKCPFCKFDYNTK